MLHVDLPDLLTEYSPCSFETFTLVISSLDVVELIMSVEDEFGVQIPDEDAAELATVGKIIEYIEARQ